MHRSPQEYDYDFSDISIMTKDNLKLHGWIIRSGEDWQTWPTIVSFHGNGGNIGGRLPYISQLIDYLKKSGISANIVMIDYRGYGYSDGKPYEHGLMIDAEATMDWVLNESGVDTSKIIIHGRSLGGAVSIYLTSKRQNDIKGLIIENTFTCLNDVIANFLPKKLRFIIKLLLRPMYTSLERIKTIKVPICYVSGRKGKRDSQTN